MHKRSILTPLLILIATLAAGQQQDGNRVSRLADTAFMSSFPGSPPGTIP
ncbi:hypothetical protein [Chitinophaga sp.]|nr:hypothetical protein [uncultured Chitinophaga sp.]